MAQGTGCSRSASQQQTSIEAYHLCEAAHLKPFSFTLPGYLKAVWPNLLGAFLKSGRPRRPGKAFKNVGGEAATFLKASPGPRGRPDLKNAPNKFGQTAFRYPVGTLKEGMVSKESP